MTLPVGPTPPVIAVASASLPQGAAVLVPGTVVNATVLQAADNLAQIAIANLALDVVSAIPLTSGQTLELAVSQAPDGGVRLAIVGQGASASAASPPGSAAGTAADQVSLSPQAQASGIRIVLPAATGFEDPLTPLQRIAVEMAAETAATRQQSLAPLFANLTAAITQTSLPPALQDAAAQVLAQQTPLQPELSGTDVQAAFQRSGLLFESALAAPQSAGPSSGVADLKASLIVLRQVLASVIAASGTSLDGPVIPATMTAAAPGYSAGNPGATPMASSAGSSAGSSAASSVASSLAPSLVPEDGGPALRPQAQPALLPQGVASASASGLADALAGLAPGSATPATILNLLQEALQQSQRSPNQATTTIVLPDGRSEDVTLRTLTPPPPIRGAWPSSQPVANSTIPPGAPLATLAHHLLQDTDAALARQTLLQIASLPQSPSQAADAQANRIDPNLPRWNFEIPFATQQGTAMAQFEISRDGAGREVEGAQRVWRARFTLDVEPAGPVHALVSFSGERTSVRMWAERPQTAARLRAGAFELSQALSRAELVPGDIVIREGSPPQQAPAKAGYFLDRAL